MQHECRCLDLRRINRCELVCLAQIKEMIGIGEAGPRCCRLVEEAFDFEPVADCLCRIFAFLGWRRCKCLARPFPAIGLAVSRLDAIRIALRPYRLIHGVYRIQENADVRQPGYALLE